MYKRQVEDGVIKGARLVMGGVAPTPLHAKEAEGFLIGQKVGAEAAEKAAEIALQKADPFEKNRYKVQEVKNFIKESILRLA